MLALVLLATTAVEAESSRTEPASTQVMLDSLQQSARDWKTIKSTVETMLAPMPGVALSPSLALASLAGLGLLCGHWPGAAPLCANPVMQEAKAASTLTLFLALAAFSVVCLLANTGKLQGLVGKLLKAAEIVPTLLVWFLFAHSVVPQVAANAATASIVGITVAVLYGLAAAGALFSMIALRFAVELIVWLSPVPLVDLFFELGTRGLAIAMLLLWLTFPTAAAAFSLCMTLGSLLALRWAIQVLEFAFVVVVRPLLSFFFGERSMSAVEPALWRDVGDQSTTSIALHAVALQLPGVRKRAAGVLVKTGRGLHFVHRKWGRRLEVPVQARFTIERRAWWLELHALDGQRVVLPVCGELVELELARALGSATSAQFAHYEFSARSG